MNGCSPPPTLAGFQAFITNVMMIPALELPLNSAVIPVAFNVARAIVNLSLASVAGPIYELAVYNLAGSNLINFAQNQPGRTYFTDLREELKINEFQAGVVAGTSDQSTAISLLNPEFMKGLTLANLQQLKDFYGRQYLMFAQSYGPTIWGLS